MHGDTWKVGSQVRERITDISTLAPGDKLLVIESNDMSFWLDVVGTYNVYNDGRIERPSVPCRTYPMRSIGLDSYETLLTPSRAASAAVWRVTEED